MMESTVRNRTPAPSQTWITRQALAVVAEGIAMAISSMFRSWQMRGNWSTVPSTGDSVDADSLFEGRHR